MIWPSRASLVRLLTVNLDSGIRRRQLLLRPHHLRDELFRKRPVTNFNRHWRRSGYRAFAVIGIRAHAERDGSAIRLVMPRQVRTQSGCGPDANGKHAAGKRIKRAGMSHALLAENPTAPIHHVVRCHARGFVYSDNQRQPRFPSLHEARTASASAARTCATASSSVQRSVKPAAAT